MANFEIRTRGIRSESRARTFTISEGRYRGGIYQLIKLDSRNLKVGFHTPASTSNPSFLDGYSQTLPQGRISDTPPSPIKTVLGKAKEFQAAGKALIEDVTRSTERAVLISDGSNYPFNEGHFVIKEGQMLPLPPGAHPISGKHYVLNTSNGRISFSLVDMDDRKAVQNIQEGIFVPKIIHDGQGIGLLEEVPGTGQISIADFRGHIGQIVKEQEYSEPGTDRRVAINTLLLHYLRNPKTYLGVLQDIVQGKPVDFGSLGNISFSLNPYNHTYWIESDKGEIYSLKTYPTSGLWQQVGVTFAEGPGLLFEIANAHQFKIKDAYIGTNGKDVRVIIPQNGISEPIRTTIDGTEFGKYLDRPIANFLAFSLAKPSPSDGPKNLSGRQTGKQAKESAASHGATKHKLSFNSFIAKVKRETAGMGGHSRGNRIGDMITEYLVERKHKEYEEYEEFVYRVANTLQLDEEERSVLLGSMLADY